MHFQKFFRRFRRDTRGTVAIVFSLSLLSLCGVAGLAVDASRAYSVSHRISSILDASALAGAKLLDDVNASDQTIAAASRAYFQVHTQDKTLAGLKLTNFSVAVDRPNNKVIVDIDVSLPTSFAQVMGFTEFAFHRTSQVVLDMQKIELALVLDITGSMNDAGKLPAMKAAASDLIDNLMAGSTSEDSIRVAVAPFAASVNAGSLAGKVSSSPSVTTCGFTFFFGYKCTTSAGADVDTCVIERNNSRAFTDDPPSGADVLPAVPSLPYGNYSCSSSTVIPLMGKSQADTIKSTINSYVALGSTAGHIGAAWGWYLLSPKWASVFPSASAPAAYSDNKVSKYVIFLTDGIFNTSFKSGSGTDPTTMQNESYAQFQSLCANMKTAGVNVYTIALDLTDPRALSELSACGGGNSFTASNGSDLIGIFRQIVSHLNTLRVAS